MTIPSPTTGPDDARLAALRSFRVVEAMAEPGLDRITRLTGFSLGMPMVWISLIDDHWVLPQSCFGVALAPTPRHAMPCLRVMESDAVLVVGDLHRDDRFTTASFPEPLRAMHFYAGAPLVTSEGHRIGALCVMDFNPNRVLSGWQRATLTGFAALVMDQLDLRRSEFGRATVAGRADPSDDACLSVDPAGDVTFVNRAAETMLGHAPGSMLGKSIDCVIPAALRDGDRANLVQIAREAIANGAGRTIELTALHRDGTRFPIELSLSVRQTPMGNRLEAIIRDISAWRARDPVLVLMAQGNTLSGLANRAQFDARLRASLEAREHPGVLLLNLDGFKEVNDSLGHAIGDMLLQAVAVRLPLCVTQNTLVAWFGGDAFALMLPSGTEAASCATAILDAFRAPFHLGEHTVHVGLSIGAALATEGAVSPDDLVADADLALYQAKTDGRGCLRVFDPVLRRAALARRTLQDDLSRALKAGELVLHYQPQVALGTSQVIGVEALLRWQHPERGLLLPGAFLSALEAHPCVDAVGRWIIEESCRQAAAWRAAKLPPLRVAVNLFGVQLKSGTLARDVMNSLDRYRLDPAGFEVEVTERIALQADDTVLDPLRELHARGVSIAFDDFGTGYASLSSLKRVPLTRLKIDRSFVRDVLTGRHDAGIIRAVLGMADSFGLQVIAEGIERPEQETILRAMGCHEGQGFLYGQAMTPRQVAALIRGKGNRRLSAA